jgi:hypothetical protein
MAKLPGAEEIANLAAWYGSIQTSAAEWLIRCCV